MKNIFGSLLLLVSQSAFALEGYSIDKIVNTLKADPKYVVELTKAHDLPHDYKGPGVSYNVNRTLTKLICMAGNATKCTEGEYYLEFKVVANANDGAFDSIVLGTMNATVKYLDEKDLDVAGAWVENVNFIKK